MRNILLTVDLEEFVTPAEVGMDIKKDELFNISIEGFNNLIKILSKYPDIKVTFFTTLEFAEKSKSKLKELLNSGHEIALHGLYHKTSLLKMDKKDVKKELLLAKNKLEKMFNIKVKGFRSPQMKGIDLKLLKEIGIKYDSSLHPTYVPGKYNNFFKKRERFFDNIWEVPVSVVPIIRAPFSWVWFRNFGLNYAKICTRLVFIDKDYVNLYFHPWDFVDINKKPFAGNISKVILRNSGNRMIKKFDKYLSWCENNFKSITMGEYVNGCR